VSVAGAAVPQWQLAHCGVGTSASVLLSPGLAEAAVSLLEQRR
jgi:hypothetical protein